MQIKVKARTPDFSGTWNIESTIHVPNSYTSDEINVEVKKHLKYAWQDQGWVIADYCWARPGRKNE